MREARGDAEELTETQRVSFTLELPMGNVGRAGAGMGPMWMVPKWWGHGEMCAGAEWDTLE